MWNYFQSSQSSRVARATFDIASCSRAMAFWGFLFILAGLSQVVHSAPPPQIEIPAIPVYGTTEDVAGRVDHVNPADYRVAVYIWVGGGWWTKPYFDYPSVVIGGDGTWTCDITTGGDDIHSTRISAFLIPAGATPPRAEGLETLPEVLRTMAAASVAVQRGPYDRLLDFSGYTWRVKKSDEPVGPGPNVFSDDPAAIWVDDQGLHLTIAKPGASWRCTEAILERNLGYGTYIFHTSGRLDILDPYMVAGLFTWDSSAPPYYREMDFEFARWGDGADPTNAQYVVQPSETSGNLERYRVDLTDAASSLTLAMDWSPNRVEFKTLAGHLTYEQIPTGLEISSWLSTGSRVPGPGGENIRINFWLSGGHAPTSGVGAEFIVKAFYFKPLTLLNTNTCWRLY